MTPILCYANLCHAIRFYSIALVIFWPNYSHPNDTAMTQSRKPEMIVLPLFDKLFTLENDAQIVRDTFQSSDPLSADDLERVAATESVRWSNRRGSKRSRETRVLSSRKALDSSCSSTLTFSVSEGQQTSTLEEAQIKRRKTSSSSSIGFDNQERGQASGPEESLYFSDESKDEESSSDEEENETKGI